MSTYTVKVGKVITPDTGDRVQKCPCLVGVGREDKVTVILEATPDRDHPHQYVRIRSRVYVSMDSIGELNPGDFLGGDSHWRGIETGEWRTRLCRGMLALEQVNKVMRRRYQRKVGKL